MRIEKPTPIGDHVITIRELTVADIRACWLSPCSSMAMSG
jgi:hypothetical protein